MKREAAKLERLLKRHEHDPHGNMVKALEALIGWLPRLTRRIKNH